MEKHYKRYLFGKHILVSESMVEPKQTGTPSALDFFLVFNKNVEMNKSRFDILFSLAHLFDIKITKGAELVQRDMIRFVSECLGRNVPEPFYRGFPESVRKLTGDQLLFDQLVHYAITYGFGDFSKPGHSLFEAQFERTAFNEDTEIKSFSIITEEEAVAVLGRMVNNLLAGTRPLSDEQYALVKDYILDYHFAVQDVASRNTCVRLLLDTRDLRLAEFIFMSDVIKLVDELNYRTYGNENIRKLNLKNQDRKFVIKVMGSLFKVGRVDLRNCYEKKKIWSGLLHHIHYKPKTAEEKQFSDAMRGNRNLSVYAEFEKEMAQKNISAAVDALQTGKGSTAVLRNLNYIISRCESPEEVEYALKSMDTKNVIILLQLLVQYSLYKGKNISRTFKFTKYNRLKIHVETPDEKMRRKSVISEERAHMLADKVLESLKKALKNRLGKVYIDPDMKNYAIPIQENISQGGFGVLARGSRIRIPETKKLRAFTYWEMVDDIDLSVFGLDDNYTQKEFSWRTMAFSQSGAITFSGDQTSGYYGGSEYFDIDLSAFRTEYPDIHYLIFCNNVYSKVPFSSCFCKAGYMSRDLIDSGQVFEPSTVKSSFIINTNSTFAYLFGVDLETNDFIWLNMARESKAAVAGETGMRFLTDYFHMTDIINIYSLFEMMADELVTDLSEAEVVVTDKDVQCKENVLVIREYDTEKMIALMNKA